MITLAAILIGLGLLAATGTFALRTWNQRRADEAALVQRLTELQAPGASPKQADWAEQLAARAPAFLRIWLGRADVEPKAAPLLLYLGGLALVAIAIGRSFGVIYGLVLLSAGAAAPLVVLYVVAQRRAAAFVEGLPYFLDALRQLLAVGQSLQQAFVRAAEETNPTVARYLAPAVRRVNNGAAMPDAITAAAERVDIAEFHMLATAVRLNMVFGGAVGPILGELAETLRNRARIAREIRGATAETRASAFILSTLPLVAIGMLLVVQPDYVSFLWRTDLGRRMMLVAVGLQGLGMLVMRRLIEVEF